MQSVPLGREAERVREQRRPGAWPRASGSSHQGARSRKACARHQNRQEPDDKGGPFSFSAHDDRSPGDTAVSRRDAKAVAQLFTTRFACASRRRVPVLYVNTVRSKTFFCGRVCIQHKPSIDGPWLVTHASGHLLRRTIRFADPRCDRRHSSIV